MDPEGWVMRASARGLVLCGGRPRGTLYAVYRFLEDEVGVRFWTPRDETVPRRRRLDLSTFERRGRPAFVYRDVHGEPAPGLFYARNRVNGHFNHLSGAWGGSERYGPPRHVHDFYDYVPPRELFREHPEYFSEVAGLRFGGAGQLCLTNVELAELVARRLAGYVVEARAEAARRGAAAPRLFDISQNDWGHPCGCDACSRLAAEEQGESGPLIAFVNRVAARIGPAYPQVLIDTLAYSYTFEPPRSTAALSNVTVRVAPLYQRDFAAPVTAPSNRKVLAALRGWKRRTRHLRVWDYIVTFGDAGDLPLPNIDVIAADLRFYRDLGVEGVFVQHAHPVDADVRDLKQWVVTKLLEDPDRDPDALVREFTEGYYGAAGTHVRRYLRLLQRSARRHPARIGFPVDPRDFAWLEPDFLLRGQAVFDRAARAVEDDPLLRARVEHARLTLDRATLLRAADPEVAPALALLDVAAVRRRYRTTWIREIERRLPVGLRARSVAAVDAWLAERAP
jgi:hypothetical protein